MGGRSGARQTGRLFQQRTHERISASSKLSIAVEVAAAAAAEAAAAAFGCSHESEAMAQLLPLLAGLGRCRRRRRCVHDRFARKPGGAQLQPDVLHYALCCCHCFPPLVLAARRAHAQPATPTGEWHKLWRAVVSVPLKGARRTERAAHEQAIDDLAWLGFDPCGSNGRNEEEASLASYKDEARDDDDDDDLLCCSRAPRRDYWLASSVGCRLSSGCFCSIQQQIKSLRARRYNLVALQESRAQASFDSISTVALIPARRLSDGSLAAASE